MYCVIDLHNRWLKSCGYVLCNYLVFFVCEHYYLGHIWHIEIKNIH